MDYAYNETEKALAELEQKIKEIYADASRELKALANDYFDAFRDRDAHQRELMEAGTITKEQYQLWRMAQLGRGERFLELQKKTAQRCNQANQVALAYVNDTTPGIYSLNYNYSAYSIEKNHGDVGFTLFDEQTVRRLMADDPELLPAPRIDIPLDLKWSKQKLQRELVTGIMLGESTDKLAARFRSVTDMNLASALRNARTAYTGAQNAGRQESYNRAKELGINLRKQWVAVKDARTRHSHAALDGQIVGIDDCFVSFLGSRMMYPGDREHSADPSDIYNCRCGMRTVEKDGIEAEARKMRVRDPITGKNELISEMSYQEWYNWKRGQNPDAFDIALKKNRNSAADRAQYEKYVNQLGNSVAKTFADFQEMKYNKPDEYNLLKRYAKDVRTGWVSPLSGFKNYKNLYNRIQTEIVGKAAANGTVITGQVPHFMQRVIGTMVDPQKLKGELKIIRRSGVEVDYILSAVFNPIDKSEIQTRASGKRSIKFYGERCVVTINPDSGELIQTNLL